MTRNSIRRTGLVLLSLLLPLSPLSAEDEKDLRELLRDALYTEEVTRDPDAAAKQYEALLSQHDAQRAFAASALFRLAEVRRKQDRKDEAIALYQKLLARFPEAAVETKLARENLTALGAEAAPAEAQPEDDEARELRRLQQQVESSPDKLKDPELLMATVKAGHLKAIEFLLKAGAACEPWKLLEEAVKTGNLRTISLLMDYPFKETRGEDGALFLAVTLEFHDVVRLLLDHGVNPNPGPTQQGYYQISESVRPPSQTKAFMTPLHVAVRKRDVAMCEMLLDHKADPNCLAARMEERLTFENDVMPGHPMGTPLHDAVVCSLEITRLLLERGADPKVASPATGYTALHSAARRSYLVPEEQREAILAALVEKGAVLDAPTTAQEPAEPKPANMAAMGTSQPGGGRSDLIPKGTTPLGVAIEESHLAATRWLIKAGASTADPNLLVQAVQTKRTELVRVLLAATKKPVISPDVFLWAVGNGDDDMIRLLVEAGADPSAAAPAHNNLTPLLVAAESDSDKNKTQLLIDLGAKPDAEWRDRDFQGARAENRPLLYHRFVVPSLLERNAVTLITPESWGKGPRELAAGGGDAAPLPLAYLLLNRRMEWTNILANGGQYPMQVTVFRKEGDGIETMAARLDGEKELPVLKWGDVVELGPDWGENGRMRNYNVEYSSEAPAAIRWQLMKRIAFPVTVEIDGKSRQLTMQGDRLIFDPGSDVVPLVGASRLAKLLWQPEINPQGGPSPKVSVMRKGWPSIEVDWDRTSKTDCPLEPGDTVIVKTFPLGHEDELIRRKQYIAVTGAGLPFSRYFNEMSGRMINRPTLLQAIADLTGWWANAIGSPQADPAVLIGLRPYDDNLIVPLQLLPHPDLSKIVIRRLQDDGTDTRMPVDLAAAIAKAGADVSQETARAADVELKPGDIVEIPQLAGMAGKPWPGPSEQEGRFFAQALDCRIHVTSDQGGMEMRRIHYQSPRFVEVAGQWIPMRPEEGVASLTAAVALGQGRRSVGLARSGTDEKAYDSAEDLFLRDGDVVEISEMPNAPSRVVPPPQAPSVRPPRPRNIVPAPR
ncbi:ankyrin repeat domain-containing protein [Luteolibacter soli]|uniref:Ankyrin repeat domain-containing protein n=1 Tax=Luteolibacter soli TaxID=3135280 RepID=A0ABU9AQP6_9BACT